MLSPALVAVKSRSPRTKMSSSLNPNAKPFINLGASAFGIKAGSRATTTTITRSPAPAPPAPPPLMTSAPLPLSMRPPLLPHQFFNRPQPPHSPPTSPAASPPATAAALVPISAAAAVVPISAATAIPISSPTFPHQHYYNYYYHHHHQTALHYTSFRPSYPHPASAAAYQHQFSAAAAAASSPYNSSSPFSYTNNYGGSGVQQIYHHHHQIPQAQPPTAVSSYPVQPVPKPAPESVPKVDAAAASGVEKMMFFGGRSHGGGKGRVLQRRFRVGMVTRRKAVAARGGPHRSRVSSSSPSSTPKKSTAAGSVGEDPTSLMIKNIPNEFQRFHLLHYLDLHCADVNSRLLAAATATGQQKPVDSSGDAGGFVVSEYDFVYLPMDFGTGANLGYAFVNFTTPVAASRFEQSFNNYQWIAASKPKICEIVPAYIQGKEGLMNHFKDSKFRCKFNDYLPVVFSPPRGGLMRPTATGRTTWTLIGQRLPPKMKLQNRRGRHYHRLRHNRRLG